MCGSWRAGRCYESVPGLKRSCRGQQEDQRRKAVDFRKCVDGVALHKFVCQQEKAADAAFNGFDMPGCYLIAKYQKGDHDKDYSDYLGIYVGSSEHMSDGIVSIPTRLGDPDVYADCKYHQNVMLFVFPCELKDLDERRELLLRSFEGSRLYNGSEVLA